MSARHIMQQAALGNASYHLALSSDIGRAVTCGLKFKLPRVMGTIAEGNESFIPGFIAHNVLEGATETLGRLWYSSPTPNPQEIMDAWDPYVQHVFADVRLMLTSAEHLLMLTSAEHLLMLTFTTVETVMTTMEFT